MEKILNENKDELSTVKWHRAAALPPQKNNFLFTSQPEERPYAFEITDVDLFDMAYARLEHIYTHANSRRNLSLGYPINQRDISTIPA